MIRTATSLLSLALLLLSSTSAFSTSPRSEAVFQPKENAFKEQLTQRKQAAESKEATPQEFKMNLEGLDLPGSPHEFDQVWHHPPRPQDLTGTCWAFSAVSFFESEIYRIHGRKIKLSEMYTVYWEFVEKAREFVRSRGQSVFSRGSQPNAAMRIWKEYGIVPLDAYDGCRHAEGFYDDTDLYAELKAYLQSVKTQGAWNETEVVATVRSMLDHYMGTPPTSVPVDARDLLPPMYLEQVAGLSLDDYVDLMSLLEQPFGPNAEYPVADNWWHCRDYFNMPLEDFVKAIREAIRGGYSVCIAGDNSEVGFCPKRDVAMIPAFDVPSESIDDNARQLRFSNESTTDDHAIHLVGILEKNGSVWYLIKDSGTRAQNGDHPGYMFYHEDFVKLKMLNLIVHRDALLQNESGLKGKADEVVPRGEILRFLAQIGSGSYHDLAREGARLFVKDALIPDHAVLFKDFPAKKNAKGQLYYVLFESRGDGGAAAISLLIDEESGRILAFNAYDASF